MKVSQYTQIIEASMSKFHGWKNDFNLKKRTSSFNNVNILLRFKTIYKKK